MQINIWDKVVENHYYTVAVVQLHGRIFSSRVHYCKQQSIGTHYGNSWMGVLKVLYLELKAKAVLNFNTSSQAKLELKVEAVL